MNIEKNQNSMLVEKMYSREGRKKKTPDENLAVLSENKRDEFAFLNSSQKTKMN